MFRRVVLVIIINKIPEKWLTNYCQCSIFVITGAPLFTEL
jgi:hypothetical protein